MKLSITESYERFPVVPLTSEWAEKCGHIDFFESEDENYAIARMIKSVTDATTPFNVAVWLPSATRYTVSQDTLESIRPSFDGNTAWQLHPSGSYWEGVTHIDGDPKKYKNGFSRLPKQLVSNNVTVDTHMKSVRETIAQAVGTFEVYAEMRAEPTREHFATGNNLIGAPHVDTGGDEVRLLEYYHGAGSYIVPNASWKSLTIDPETRDQNIDWTNGNAGEQGGIIAPLLQVPSHAVICMNSIGMQSPILHGAALDPCSDGVIEREERLFGVYAFIHQPQL